MSAIDFQTDVGQVRLLISDVDPDNRTFDDDEIQAFLTLEGTVRLAAAQALETLASNEALFYKKFKVLRTMETDGPAVAASLLARAEMLRNQEYEDGSFEIAGAGCLVPELTEWPTSCASNGLL